MRFDKFLSALAVAGLVGLIAIEARSDTMIFMDDFNSENTGDVKTRYRNYRSFSNWDVTSGAVDLLGHGEYDFLPGNGLYVDMQNIASRGGGTLELHGGLDLEPGTYDLKFDLGGSQLDSGEPRELNVLFGNVSERFSVPFDSGFVTQTLGLDLTSFTSGVELIFQQNSTNTKRGMILDNVMVTVRLPEPATLGMMITGGLLALRRHRVMS